MTAHRYTIASIKPLDPSRCVAEVAIGPVMCGSIYVVECDTEAPRVSWPRTARGYPIVVVAQPLRSMIEADLLAHLPEARG